MCSTGWSECSECSELGDWWSKARDAKERTSELGPGGVSSQWIRRCCEGEGLVRECGKRMDARQWQLKEGAVWSAISRRHSNRIRHG